MNIKFIKLASSCWRHCKLYFPRTRWASWLRSGLPGHRLLSTNQKPQRQNLTSEIASQVILTPFNSPVFWQKEIFFCKPMVNQNWIEIRDATKTHQNSLKTKKKIIRRMIKSLTIKCWSYFKQYQTFENNFMLAHEAHIDGQMIAPFVLDATYSWKCYLNISITKLSIIQNKIYQYQVVNVGNDHLIEFHLTFSVDRNFLLIWAFDQNFLFFILVSWSNFTWHFQLIESSNIAFKKFRSTAKIRRFFFGSWSKF